MTSEFSIAVHALVFLDHKKTTVSSEVLSDNVCTNPARIRKIMAMLKKADIVMTKEGIDGGYFFHRNASEVTLEDVCRAVNMKIVCAGWKSGDVDKECLVSSGMGAVMDAIYENLDCLCKKKLAEITIEDVSKKIFREVLK